MRRFFYFLLVLLLPIFLHSQSHVLRQLVSDWPAGYDETGAKWVVYDVTNPAEDVLDESSIGSFTIHSGALNAIRWNANTGNFPTPWQNGDRLLQLGSWDSSPLSYCHHGFYWVFNDTLDATQDPQTWEPSDTLMEIPIPWVVVSGDTVSVSWLKPYETGGTFPDTLNIMGFVVFVDTTGTGLAYNFHEIASVVNTPGICHPGMAQDTLMYVDLLSNYPSTVSGLTYGIRLVARPDTGNGSGYTTHYLSGNSGFIPVGGYPLRGEVHNWPGVDTSGVFWGLYKVANPSVDYLMRSSWGSCEYFEDTVGYYEWYQDGGNFGSGWTVGDELIAFVDYDSAVGDFAHTGFYAVVNDTLDAVMPKVFTDSIRAIPEPWVVAEYGSSGDTVFVDSVDTGVQWLRAQETVGNPAAVNVMGYMVYVDETGSGLPSSYQFLDYVPSTGADTLSYVDMNEYALGRVLYYALKLVYRPDVPGHTSLYLSSNSNPAKIVPGVGCEEGQAGGRAFSFNVSPVLTRGGITVSLSLPQSEHVELDLIGIDGRVVEHLFEGNLDKGYHNLVYAPMKQNGVYFLVLKMGAKVHTTKKVICVK